MKLWFTLLALAIAIGQRAEGQTPAKVPQGEQMRFGLEEPLEQPAPIPEDVLEILRRDSDVRTCEIEGGSRDAILATWYEASQIHLDGPNEIDLIIKAKNACLWGPNINPFWIFRGTRNSHRLVLSTIALGLQVLKTKTNGLRDVRGGAIVRLKPNYVTYKFDGRTYQQR